MFGLFFFKSPFRDATQAQDVPDDVDSPGRYGHIVLTAIFSYSQNNKLRHKRK